VGNKAQDMEDGKKEVVQVVAKVRIFNSEDVSRFLIWNNRKHGNNADLPGGSADPGETAKMAAIRELKEELGLHIIESALHEVDTVGMQIGKTTYKIKIFDIVAPPNWIPVLHEAELHWRPRWITPNQAQQEFSRNDGLENENYKKGLGRKCGLSPGS